MPSQDTGRCRECTCCHHRGLLGCAVANISWSTDCQIPLELLRIIVESASGWGERLLSIGKLMLSTRPVRHQPLCGGGRDKLPKFSGAAALELNSLFKCQRQLLRVLYMFCFWLKRRRFFYRLFAADFLLWYALLDFREALLLQFLHNMRISILLKLILLCFQNI